MAGAQVLHYGDDERIGESYRGLRIIRWLVARRDAVPAAVELLASLDVDAADGTLPAPFVYVAPNVWPHIRTLYVEAGGTLSRFAGWAHIGNLVAGDDAMRVWLLAQARHWLRLGGVTRLVADADAGGDSFYLANGFRELVTTDRAWARARERFLQYRCDDDRLRVHVLADARRRCRLELLQQAPGDLGDVVDGSLEGVLVRP